MKKLLDDPIYFIENYIVVDGEHIVLHDYQKKFIKLFQKIKNKLYE